MIQQLQRRLEDGRGDQQEQAAGTSERNQQHLASGRRASVASALWPVRLAAGGQLRLHTLVLPVPHGPTFVFLAAPPFLGAGYTLSCRRWCLTR